MLFEININEMVKVKLTDHGREMLRKNHDELWANSGGKPYKQLYAEDKDGWVTFQMWELMHEFGEHTCMGGKNCIEGNIVRIEKGN